MAEARDTRLGLTVDDTFFIKGIAAIMLVFHHCFRDVSTFPSDAVSFFPLTQGQGIHLSLYFKTCVSLFVFCSGYGFCYQLRKPQVYEKWCLKRLVKLYAAFWFVYAVVFVVLQVYLGFPYEVYFGKGTLLGVVYLLADVTGLSSLVGTPSLSGVWWYMSAAIIFILAAPLLFEAAERYGYLPVLVLVELLPRLLKMSFPGNSPFSYFGVLVLGMLFCRYGVFDRMQAFAEGLTVPRRVLTSCLLIAVFVASIFLYARLPRESLWEYHYLFALLPILMLCWWASRWVNHLVFDAIHILGVHSTNIFFIHNFIRAQLLYDLTYSFGHFVWSGLFVLLVSLAVSLFFEKMKTIFRYQRLTEVVGRSLGL